MAQVIIPNALAAACDELARLRSLDVAGLLEPSAMVPPPPPALAPVVITVVQHVAASATLSPAAAAPAAAASTAASAQPTTTSVSSAAATSPRASVAASAAVDEAPLTESERGELRRLDATLHELAETNDRIMAQNIALLADLETAQRAVRELREEKDALAVQLKRALEQ
jgi:small-conductance mechanosensitive channel